MQPLSAWGLSDWIRSASVEAIILNTIASVLQDMKQMQDWSLLCCIFKSGGVVSCDMTYISLDSQDIQMTACLLGMVSGSMHSNCNHVDIAHREYRSSIKVPVSLCLSLCAGAITAGACILCQPGTYQTGSGQAQLQCRYFAPLCISMLHAILLQYFASEQGLFCDAYLNVG